MGNEGRTVSCLRRILRLVGGVCAVACALLGVLPAVASAAAAQPAADVTHHAHRTYADPRDVSVGTPATVRAKTGRRVGAENSALTSSDWSGYRVTTSADSVSYNSVSATWVEPNVTCNSIAADAGQYASFWVGLDQQDFTDANVQQDGSTVYCNGATAEHYIWWEEAPYNAAQSFASVNGGDTITASTVYSPTTAQFTFTVTDVTTSQTYTETTGCPSGETCGRFGAEWIAEAPHADGEQAPLFPYGTVDFTHADATDANGHSGVITDSAWQYDSYTEQSVASLGTPGAIGTGGDNFPIAAKTGVLLNTTVPGLAPANSSFAPVAPVYVEGDFDVLGQGGSDWVANSDLMSNVNTNVWAQVLYSSSDVALEYEYDLGGTGSELQATSSCGTVGHLTVDVGGQEVDDTVAHWAGPADCGSSQVTITVSSTTVPSGATMYLAGNFSGLGEFLPSASWDWKPALVPFIPASYNTWSITLRGAPGSTFTYTADLGGWNSLALTSTCGQQPDISVTFPSYGNLGSSSVVIPKWGNTTACPAGDPDLALSHTATASSTASGYPASNAVDGNTSSYWESLDGAAYPQTLKVDLGATEGIGRLVLNLPPSTSWATRTETLSVLGSTDGTNYTTLVSSAGYTFNPSTGNTATISTAQTGVRYLELVFTANTGWSAAQLSELSAYLT